MKSCLVPDLRSTDAERAQIEHAIVALELLRDGGKRRRRRPPKWLVAARARLGDGALELCRRMGDGRLSVALSGLPLVVHGDPGLTPWAIFGAPLSGLGVRGSGDSQPSSLRSRHAVPLHFPPSGPGTRRVVVLRFPRLASDAPSLVGVLRLRREMCRLALGPSCKAS